MAKVSIIIPCFNQEKYIKEAIDSALSQTYKDLEIVILDDASNDKSAEIIEKISASNSNIKFIKEQENKGIIYSRNKLIEIASGEYILPLDGDDTIEKTYVEKAVKILDNNPDIGIVYCNVRIFGKKNKNWILPEFNKDEIIFENQIVISSMFRKSDFIKTGGFKEYMEGGYEDWDLWLSFVELGVKAKKIDEFLFNYRRPYSKTRSKDALKKTEENLPLMVKNHINLYLENKKAMYGVISGNKELQKVKKKYKKYKNLFYLFLTAFILESLFVLIKIFLDYNIFINR